MGCRNSGVGSGLGVGCWYPTLGTKVREMKVTFDTKDNLNHKRERDFLAMSGDERFRTFLKMVVEMSVFERKPRKREQHFVLTKDEL